jgi:hypothetical protein
MKLKKKVIKFRKVERNYSWASDTHQEICGSSIVCEAVDLAKKHGGFVCSFRDKDNFDILKCKLVIRIPDGTYADFISDFIRLFNGYIKQVRW